MNPMPRSAETTLPFDLSHLRASSPDGSAFFSSVSGPPSPLVNLSPNGDPRRPHLPSQPSIQPPIFYASSPPTTPRDSALQVPSAPIVCLRDVLLDIRRQIASMPGVQDPTIMIANSPTHYGIRPTIAAPDIDFDRRVREQSARRRSGDGFVDNTVHPHQSSGPIISQLISTVNGIVDLLRDRDHSSGLPVGFEQQNEIRMHSHAHGQRLESDMHDWGAEIRSVSARLERTREEVIPLLNRIAEAMGLQREAGAFSDAVPPPDAATSESAAPEVLPPVIMTPRSPSLPGLIPPPNPVIPAGGRLPSDTLIVPITMPVDHYDVVQPGPFAAAPDVLLPIPRWTPPTRSPPTVVRTPVSLVSQRDVSTPYLTPPNKPFLEPQRPLQPSYATSSSKHHHRNRSQRRMQSPDRQRSPRGSPHSFRQRPTYLGDDSPVYPSSTTSGPQDALDLPECGRSPIPIVPPLPDSSVIEKGQLSELLEQNNQMRNHLDDLTKLIMEQRDEMVGKNNLADERWTANKAHWENREFVTDRMHERGAENHSDTMNTHILINKELAGELRGNHRQVLHAIEQHRTASERAIHEIAEALRADCEKHKVETIEVITSNLKATANTQVPFNIQGYLDEFSRLLAGEVRLLLGNVGKLSEDKRNLESQIGELLTLKAKYGPGGQLDPSWKPTSMAPFAPVDGQVAPTPAEPTPEPEPEPQTPQPVLSSWRSRHPSGASRIPRRTQTLGLSVPRPNPVPPPAWALWQPSPATQHSPVEHA